MNIIYIRGDSMENTVKFFLGANSDNGFMSYFKQLQEHSSMQLLILKGGPGSGKSSLMKRIADYALEKGHTIQKVPCASDPDSLDAVIDITADFAVMDGTAPHIEDPVMPGAKHHILYTGNLWDCGKLRKNTEQIGFYADLTAQFHSGAGSYIRAAGALMRENIRYSSRYVLPSAGEFVTDIMKELPDGERYTEEKRLLSAVTVGKPVFFEETLRLLADDVYTIEDSFGGACEIIFETVKNIAKLKKMRTIVCPCSVMPDKTDHIILPDAGVAFTKGNSFFQSLSDKKIDENIFYREGLDKISCEKRCRDVGKLIDTACIFVKSAKKAHDGLEKIYASAMNFEGMNGLFEEIIRGFYG